MISPFGTPKSLDDVIHLALMTIPLSKVPDQAYLIFKDYLAQKFQVAMLEKPELTEEYKALFEEIVKRPFKVEAKTIEEWKRS